MTNNNGRYCPYCQRVIYPHRDLTGELVTTPDGGFIYVHDDVEHDEDYDFRDLQ